MPVHHDLMAKHTNSSHAPRNKPESQRRELKLLKMPPFCYFLRGWPTCVEEMMMKFDDRTLHFACCPLKSQTVPRETRRVVWESPMSFNAVDIPTDEETRQLTDASRETYPMQRVETDKKNICEEITIMFAYLRSTRVDWLDMETSRQRKDFAHTLLPQYLLQLVCTSSRLHSLTRIHVRIPPRIINRANLAVSYSERGSYQWSKFGFASTHLWYNGCTG